MILPPSSAQIHGTLGASRFLRDASAYFDIVEYPLSVEGQRRWCRNSKAGRRPKKTVSSALATWRALYLLKARHDVTSSYLIARGINPLLHRLDVVILDRLILRHCSDLGRVWPTSATFISSMIAGSSCEVKAGDYEAGSCQPDPD